MTRTSLAAAPATRRTTRDGRDVCLLPSCVLEVVKGADAGLRARFAQPVVRIGSDPSNDLSLQDATVSRHHLEIRLGSDGVRVVDLDSSNGTFVGAMRVHELTVTEPVTLQLGRVAIQLEPTVDQVEIAPSARQRFGRVVGRSLVMRKLFDQLEAVARTDCSVLLEGETGVGKELVAQSLHQASPRAGGPFVIVDCSALPGELMEAELFGWVRGAFTGATQSRRGLLESAHGGTVFFDEIAALSRPLQVKLLGALERRRVVPLGASTPRPIDVRVVSATSRNLGRAMNRDEFRADLFFRLAVVRLVVPALRDRLDDIPLLVETFLDALRERHDESSELSAVALARLTERPWPGNVRELRNAIERAVLRVGEPRIRPPQPPPAAATVDGGFLAAREQALAQFEQRYFSELLARSRGNMSRAARLAQMDRRYLYRVLERLGLLRGAS